MVATTVIAFLATQASGAAGAPQSSSADSRARSLAATRVSAPESYVTPSAVFVVYGEKCLSARKAVAYYRAHTHQRQSARGGTLADRTPIVRGKTCRWARYAAGVWVARAKSALKALRAWEYDWAWWKWLPDKWARIGACETGYGRRPGQWTWNSGTYQGAFGFYHGTWDQYKPRGAPSEAYLATPRQQYQCALNVAAVHGYGAWGCGGA